MHNNQSQTFLWGKIKSTEPTQNQAFVYNSGQKIKGPYCQLRMHYWDRISKQKCFIKYGELYANQKVMMAREIRWACRPCQSRFKVFLKYYFLLFSPFHLLRDNILGRNFVMIQIWRLAKDLHLLNFWSYRSLQDPKI